MACLTDSQLSTHDRLSGTHTLGFADLAGYLQRRYVEQEWPVKRIRAELQVGRNWLVAEMARLSIQ